MIIHLFVDGINGFDTPLKGVVDLVFRHASANLYFNLFHKVLVLAILIADVLSDLLVSDWIEELQAEVFQFQLDTLHTKAVCQGGINVHCFQCGNTTLGIGLGGKRSHVVESVTELDKDNANIARHCQKHFSQSFDMGFFLILDLQGNDLGKTVHKHGNGSTELLFDLLQACLIRTILHRIMQKRSTDRIGIKLQTSYDLSHSNGVRDICLTAGTELPLMQFICIFIRQSDLFSVIFLFGCVEYLQQL